MKPGKYEYCFLIAWTPFPSRFYIRVYLKTGTWGFRRGLKDFLFWAGIKFVRTWDRVRPTPVLIFVNNNVMVRANVVLSRASVVYVFVDSCPEAFVMVAWHRAFASIFFVFLPSPWYAMVRHGTAWYGMVWHGMAWMASSFPSYPTGRMNELVYPVAGGMEDWVRANAIPV